MRGRAWVLLLALAGCDKVLGLQALPEPVALSNATLAAGLGHTCTIHRNGSLFCWGSNQNGVLGLGNDLPEDDAVAPIGEDKWTAISSAYAHTCGIHDDGTLWCWGDNSLGQLGTGELTDDHAPVQIAGHWKSASAGANHTCAIDSERALWCWGRNVDGELGTGTTSPYELSPVQIGGDASWLAVSAGDFHTCAVRSDQTLWCSGKNDYGELGIGTQVSSADPAQVGADTYLDVATGRYHTCAITTTGHLRCWGANFAGQAGGSSVQLDPTGILIDGVEDNDWSGVVATQNHTCAWKRDHRGFCWGDGSHGETGATLAGQMVNRAPVQLEGEWTSLAAGVHHVCGYRPDRTLWCVGSDGWGQLGQGTSTSQFTPERVSHAGTQGMWSNAVTGRYATCAIDGGMAAQCGGFNSLGELGTGDRVSRLSLADIGSPWTSLTISESTACGIAGDGSLQCWGNNEYGEFAQPLSEGSPTMTPIVGFTGTIDVSVGRHTCAIDGSGLHCWGTNLNGELGNGTPSTTPTTTIGPAVLSSGSGWDRVGVGIDFTCAHDVNLTVSCWGQNKSGELGNGTTMMKSRPMQIDGTNAGVYFASLTVGVEHACVIEPGAQGGKAWCWGVGEAGKLGNSTTVLSNTPSPVSGGRIWRQLTAGYHHTCGIEYNTSALYCWGSNERGQLGTGSDRGAFPTPQLVDSGAWTWIDTRWDHTCGIKGGELYCWGSNDDGQLVDGLGWRSDFVLVPLP